MRPATLRRAPVAVALLLLACGGKTTTQVEDPVATTLTLAVTAVTHTFLGQGIQVQATVTDQNGNAFTGAVTWSSRDETIATASTSGLIRAVANGSTVVDASVGTLSATVDVTVEQVASFVAIISGNDQQAIAGTPLPDPLVAAVQDQAGNPVEGVEVTFTPDPDSGSLDPTTTTSGADGRVSASWTLETRFGPHRAVAAIDVAEAEFSAFAGSDTPTPDLVLDDPILVNRSDPTSLETFTVSTTVTNQGDLEAVGARAQLLADGVEVGSELLGTVAASGGTVDVAYTVGPFAAGTRTFTVVVDADETILELDETNNELDRDVVVKQQQTIAPGATVPGISAAGDGEVLFRLDLPAGPPTTLTVSLSGGTGDADLWVEGGSRPRNLADYDDCISDGPTSAETCQIIEATGTYHINVFAANGTAISNTSLSVATGAAVQPFNLELVLVDSGSVAQNQAFLDAAARWNDIIVSDIPDYDLAGSTIPANACLDGQAAVTGVIDDVRIFVAIRAIDGPSGTLARAGPCAIRNGSSLAFLGTMEFDEADLDLMETQGEIDMMEAVVLHEMGHVLGIGTIWPLRGLLQAPSTSGGGGGGSCTVSNPTADTHFTGELAIDAFDAAGGAVYGSAKVPVANGEFGAGCGSADGHWRESVFDTELMTPFVDQLVPNELSAITIQSLADLGYGVDVSRADDYSLPAPLVQVPFAPSQGAPGAGASTASPGVYLDGDLYRGPVWVMDPGGRVVRILR